MKDQTNIQFDHVLYNVSDIIPYATYHMLPIPYMVWLRGFFVIYSCPGKIDTGKIDTFLIKFWPFLMITFFPERLTHFLDFEGTENVSIFPEQL